ncbi:MAG TPA: S8 family serine peptidase [Thermoanaerobaculia bacterium]|nr:S8 family serine peptidase [Thermoanaerobaculia bacterium]
MRRLTAVLFSLLLANITLAGNNESDPRTKEPFERLGRAMVLRPHQALSDADIADLASRGVKVRRALSGGRYIARVTDEAVAYNDDRIASAELMTPRMKMHRSVVHEAARAKPYMRVSVIFHDDVAFDSARNAVLAAGGALDDVFRVKYRPGRRIAATIPPAALEALAADERVLTIVGVPRKQPRAENLVSALVSQVNVVHDAPYGLSGDGVTVSLFELAEAQVSHVEFGGRLTLQHTAGGTASDKEHATHVAGTIGASGVVANAKGMAPKVRIQQFCLAVSSRNQCDGFWLDHKESALRPLGIMVDNNSWGYELGWFTEDGMAVWDGTAIFYGSYTPFFEGPDIDEIAIDEDILFVHSAGNDGDNQLEHLTADFSQHHHVDDDGNTISDQVFCYSKDGSGTDCPALCNGQPVACERPAERHSEQFPFDTIGVIASAKNVIAVGAANGIPDNLQSAILSSRGPAKDGRVKPDVVARGVNVLSPVQTDSYARKQGTSMASPVVTGISALLIEQWRKSFGGADPTAQELKALILAGATDLGNPGPDYTWGFGLANAKTSVDLIRADGGTRSRIQNVSFPNGRVESREFPLVITQAQNLKVLVTWFDPPTVLTGDEEIDAATLVNDLDVRIVDPSGVTHRAWVLDKVNFTANATRGINTIDNTEVVEIANAAPGTYRVIVTGTHVGEDQIATIVSNAGLGALVSPCDDVIEKFAPNNTPETAYGNISSMTQLNAAICTAGDVDHYKFVATKAGAVAVTVTTGDTPLRATLTANGVNVVTEIPANSTRTLNANAATVPLAFVLRIEATGALGSSPDYTFTTTFGQQSQPRRRSTRH